MEPDFDADDRAARVRLAVWDTGFKAYWHLLRHVWIYLGQIALLFAALLGLRFALGLISAMAGGGRQSTPDTIEWLLALLALLAIVSICVGCHRAILLDRKPRLFDLFLFRFRELRYLGIWMITLVALVAPVVAVARVPMPLGGSHWPIFGFFLALAAFIGPVFALAFPAAAIDRPHPLRTGIRLGRGHRLQFLGVLIVVHLPLSLLALSLGFFAGVLGDAATRIVQTLLQFGSTLAMVAATSVAYEAIAGPGRTDLAVVVD